MRKGLILFVLLFSGAVMACNESVEICAQHCEDGNLVMCSEAEIIETPCQYGCKNNACIPAEAAQCVYACADERTQMFCEKDGSQGMRKCAFACANGECTDK